MLTIESPREMIEAEIERLIGLLDRMDGDPDLEASEVDEDDDPGGEDWAEHEEVPDDDALRKFVAA